MLPGLHHYRATKGKHDLDHLIRKGQTVGTLASLVRQLHTTRFIPRVSEPRIHVCLTDTESATPSQYLQDLSLKVGFTPGVAAHAPNSSTLRGGGRRPHESPCFKRRPAGWGYSSEVEHSEGLFLDPSYRAQQTLSIKQQAVHGTGLDAVTG